MLVYKKIDWFVSINFCFAALDNYSSFVKESSIVFEM